jgi:hypothetical protein
MQTDRTTKLLLLAIALGLWFNALKPIPVQASDDSTLEDIAHDVHAIYSGVCLNSTICK